MTQSKKKHVPISFISAAVTNVLGTVPTVPGESAEQYQNGLVALIQELEAETVMQVYLAEKIFECIWWMRRYEQQKHSTLARGMANILVSNIENKSKKKTTIWDDLDNFGVIDPTQNSPAKRVHIMEIILDLKRSDEFKKILKESDYTEQSLLQEAFANKAESIEKLNSQITILTKTLSGFQASYEVLTSRKLNLERMRMQNELLSRDLNAIEMEVLPGADQPQKTRSK